MTFNFSAQIENIFISTKIFFLYLKFVHTKLAFLKSPPILLSDNIFHLHELKKKNIHQYSWEKKPLNKHHIDLEGISAENIYFMNEDLNCRASPYCRTWEGLDVLWVLQLLRAQPWHALRGHHTVQEHGGLVRPLAYLQVCYTV